MKLLFIGMLISLSAFAKPRMTMNVECRETIEEAQINFSGCINLSFKFSEGDKGKWIEYSERCWLQYKRDSYCETRIVK